MMRIYAVVSATLVLFLAWAVIAAHPWANTAKDPRLAALQARETRLHQQAAEVNRIVSRRWNVYRVQLKHRQAQIAAANRRRSAQLMAAASYSAPSVRFVHLAPVTVTRTS
jgi:DNA-binding IclR family transcriptional regulator